MQLLETKKENYIGQADPFILESGGRYYIYNTGNKRKGNSSIKAFTHLNQPGFTSSINTKL